MTSNRVLLLTANVGSIFEEPDKMLAIWMREFIKTIMKIQPKFLAIHCQEVGGKNYEETMQHVNKFIKLLLAREEMQQFDRARFFLDEDFTAIEKFTALGSLYFIHHSVTNIKIFNFQDKEFISVEGKEVLSGNIEQVTIKEKAKFPQEYFPDLIWSRKGFIRTRWSLYDQLFDLVNIHLFHDVSNISAMEKNPSSYSIQREKALLYTVERFLTDEYEKVPFFIFGDYNFRMNTYQLVKDLTVEAHEEKVKGKKNDISSILFKEKDDGKVILKVGKKDFHHFEHNELFGREKSKKLMVYDQEPLTLKNKLFEYSIDFPPSYPFSEDTEEGTSYMTTRCPGWCDRIMMSHDAKNIIINDSENPPEYKMIGEDICMGDHKPIYLSLEIARADKITTSPASSPSPTTASPNSSTQQQQQPAGNVVGVVACEVTAGKGEEQQQQLKGKCGEKTSVRQVISVNGEDIDVNDIDELNIHDNVTFEQEDLVTPEFRDFIKSKLPGPRPGGWRSGGSSKSFRNVVNHVLRSESVVKIMKRFKHRCDSESESEEDTLDVGGPGKAAGNEKAATDVKDEKSADISLPFQVGDGAVGGDRAGGEMVGPVDPPICENPDSFNTTDLENNSNAAASTMNFNENNSNRVDAMTTTKEIGVEGSGVDGDITGAPQSCLKKEKSTDWTLR